VSFSFIFIIEINKKLKNIINYMSKIIVFTYNMRLSEFLEFPSKFIENEKVLFTPNESSDLINLYQSMCNQELTRKEKIQKIKDILNICEISIGIERKKVICLLVFSVLKTEFGRSIIQENNRFREIVFNRYEEFMTINDQDFVSAMIQLRI